MAVSSSKLANSCYWEGQTGTAGDMEEEVGLNRVGVGAKREARRHQQKSLVSVKPCLGSLASAA